MRDERERIKVIRGDITQMDVDAVVNAANGSLLGGRGVDGAIHATGGPKILEECREIRRTKYPAGLPTGEAVITTGGKLRTRHVIHTVGPVWRGGRSGEEDLLRSAYLNSLKIASENGLRTVAFPGISTGAYRYPKDKAAATAISAIREYLYSHSEIEEVTLVAYTEGDYQVNSEALERSI